MLSLEQARERLLQAIQALPPETLSLAACSGRIVHQDLHSRIDLPLFDNSAMDGYAVRAQDLSQASPETPVQLEIIGRIPAGSAFPGVLQPGQCLQIFTGSLLPAGADAVVMQEDVCLDFSGRALFAEPVKPWENIRFRGEDIKAGQLLLKKGEPLTPLQLGVCAATGIDTALVGRAPRVGLLATGSELLEPGQPLTPGQIHESNRLLLAGLARQAGAEPVLFPIVPDSLEETQRALHSAFQQCDAVITSGGVSVGALDFVKRAFEALGGKLDFWRVSLRPGKPFLFGLLEGKPLFGLPGNPLSAFVTFLLLARPALLHLQGAAQLELPRQRGILRETVSNQGDRRHFVRVKLSGDGEIFLSGLQASHGLSSLLEANGLLDVPPGAVWEAGQEAAVLVWR